MLDFQTYMMRYGEHSIQAILENIERREKISYGTPVALETRWERVMGSENDKNHSTLAA